MLFKDCMLSPVGLEKRTTDKFGKSIGITPEAFLDMLTLNSADRRIANPWLVNACAEEMQRHLPEAIIKIATVFLERESIFIFDEAGRQFKKATDQELMEAEVGSLVGSRAIIKIVAEGIHDDILPSVAISLNQDGEEIALGENISICDNFTIFGSDRYHSTFARHANRTLNHLSTSELQASIQQLFPRVEAFLEEDLDLIEALKNQPIAKPAWYSFTGELFGRIHYTNRMRLAKRISEVSNDVKNLPITATLLAEIAAEAEAPSHPEYQWQDDVTTKWNAINYGTELIKPEFGVSPKAFLANNFQWTDMVMKHNFSAN